jgi:TonB family protein
MGVASSSVVSPSRNKALMVRLAPYLVEAVCELSRAVKDKTHAQTEISGLLFGKAEEGFANVEALKTFKDSGPRSDLARRERMEKAFVAALALAQEDAEFKPYKLLGWFSLRGSGGLINSDVEFHNRHFKDPDNIALLVWREGETQITAELYATEGGKLSSEDYRWSSVRLSTELRRVSQPVDLVMRIRMNDDLYVRTYAAVDKQERREEWKKITSAAKRTMLSLLPGRGREDDDDFAETLHRPKPEPSDSGFGRRPFDSRTLFKDTDSRPAFAQAVTLGGAVETPTALAPYDANRQPATPEISGLPMVIPKNKPKVTKGTPWLSAALVAILCSGVTFGIYALNGVGTGSSKLSQVMRVLFPGTDLELRADPSGDRLLLTWNRKNPVVASALNAMLTITDGPSHFERKLDPIQVANGSVLYRPISGDVTFQLRVVGTDQSIAVSSLRVLDATGVQTVGDSKPLAFDSNNAAAAQKALPPPPAENPPPVNQPVANRETRPAATTNKPSVSQPKVAEKTTPSKPATSAKTEAAKPPQIVTPPPLVVQQRPAPTAPAPGLTTSKQNARPDTATPLTGKTAINGWDSTLPENKPVAPQPPQQQPQNAAPPDAKTVAFVGPKPLLQVTPSTRNLPANLISEITRVEVEVRIDVSGRVSAAHLETPNVKPQLASAAMAAARQWTFQPATLRGQRVETSHTIIFEFRPDGQ